MTQNIYEAADQLQYKNTFKSIQELEMECLQQMQENGIPFQGPLNTNGEIHRFSIDSKKRQPDEWYVAFQGVLQNGSPYLCCTTEHGLEVNINTVTRAIKVKIGLHKKNLTT